MPRAGGGHDPLCEFLRGIVGLASDGGFAEYMVVPAANVGPLPDGVSDIAACVAVDAVATPWHALRAVAHLDATRPYRGAGRPEAAMSLERLMDELARRTGQDPANVRFTNFVPSEAFPYDTPTGARYDSGRYDLALRTAMQRGRYDAVRAEQRERRSSATSAPLLGVGLASYVERSGGQAGSTEHASVELAEDGHLVARSGSSSQGQGHRTSFGQIVASVFDVEPSRVRVIQGDTDLVSAGTGTYASRSTQVGGSALQLASLDVLDAARSAAADHLEVDAEDLRYASGSFVAVGAPQRAVSSRNWLSRASA